MTKKIVFPILIFISFIATTLSAQNEGIPAQSNPPKLVNNYSSTGFINKEEEQILEKKLQTFANETSNQIVIVIIDDLGGMDASQFATKLGDQWGVGQGKMDNGIVFLIKPSGGPSERKYFMAIGKGLEGAIPDATVQKIENNELVPNLKSGNYFAALDQTTNVLMALAKGEYNTDEYAARTQQKVDKKTLAIILIVLVILLVAFIKNGGGGSNGRMSYGPGFLFFPMGGGGHRSGGFGGGGGGFGGFGGGGFGGGGSGGSW